MKTHYYILLLLFLSLSCKNTKEEFRPTQITIFNSIEGYGSIPPVSISVNSDVTFVKIQDTTYEVKNGITELFNALDEFTNSDLDTKIDIDEIEEDLKTMGGDWIFLEIHRGDKHRKFYRYELRQNRDKKIRKLLKAAENLLGKVIEPKIERTRSNTARTLEEALNRPEDIYYLYMINDNDSLLDERLSKLTNLRELDISYSNIKSIPNEISNCKKLNTIRAEHSEIKSLPRSLLKLKSLRTINLSNSQIIKVPRLIGQLSNLWFLRLSNTNISDLPSSFENLNNLYSLDISDNNLKSFPKVIFTLKNIQGIALHGNQFERIPNELANLKTLRGINIELEKIDSTQRVYFKKVNPNLIIQMPYRMHAPSRRLK